MLGVSNYGYAYCLQLPAHTSPGKTHDPGGHGEACWRKPTDHLFHGKGRLCALFVLGAFDCPAFQPPG